MRGHSITCIGELLIHFVCPDIGLGLKYRCRFLCDTLLSGVSQRNIGTGT